MSRKDEITNKGSMAGNTRSKALNHSRRTWRLNLQSVMIKDGATARKVRVSARTLKMLKKRSLLA